MKKNYNCVYALYERKREQLYLKAVDAELFGLRTS